jgi:uncharacterized protein YhaN
VRLDSIDLIRFGHFCGQQIEFPARQPDYYLMYGDNEAGKSTLLRGISALFFGVPVKTPDVHSCKNSELRIGATISEGRERFSFRRRKGTSGTLLNPIDGQIAEDALAPFLRELDRKRFEQFFGLTHDRLREGGEELLRGQGDVGSALFQAAGLQELRHVLDKLDGDAKELFSPKSSKKTIGRVIDEYKQARSEIRKLAISAGTVKEKQAELETARQRLAKLKEESRSLQQELVRLRRIESNKPDLARLQAMRTALAALESVPILPADTGRQHDEAVAMLANANSQISTLTQDIALRERRIQELPANSLLKDHEKEIEELNTGMSAYTQSVSDRTKRLRQRDEAIETAQRAWEEIWAQPVSEAENLKNVYSSKEEILKLVGEHKGLTADLTTAEEELRNIAQEQQRLEEQLARHPDLADPAALVAAIEHAKSLGDTDRVAAKLQSDIERLTKNTQREMRKTAEWTGTIEELESLKTPLLATIDQYAKEWESLIETRRSLSLRHANALETIRQKEGELGSLTAQIAGAGEGELSSVRARRDLLWQLVRASTFDKKISREEARRQSGSSSSLADTFADQLRKADEIADIRFAHARDVVIHDRLMKEIALARADQQRIEKELERLEGAEGELRERWANEWTALGSAPLSPSEMKEWMQARQSILAQYEQAREREEELQSLQQRATSAAAQITAKWAALQPDGPPDQESLPILLKMAEAFAKQRESERRARDDIQRQLKSLSVERRRGKLDECNQRLQAWSQKWSPYVRALALPETSSPDQVARALAVLEKVFQQLDEAKGLQYRIKRIGDNIDAFEKRASQVAVALGPLYASLASDASVRQLHSQLLELRDAGTAQKTLREQNNKDRSTLAACRERAQQASATLGKLKALANCEDDQQLETAITASEQKSALQQEHKRISAGLIERNAIADLAQIEQEAAAHDLDSLQSEIATKANRLTNSVDDISQAASRHGELKTEFEGLETSEESALQSQKAEEALAQLRPAIAHYLRLRLASEVLRQAIESYRKKHQGPILTRASELFARLTDGRHSGLTSDFGDDDKPVLVAIRHNDERVHVEGLSDGTRDQMYLALRLAAIEHHVKTVGPCPVIFDDLLINSDDARSSAALQVIGELAKSTQVLFFTHHRRLADLGTKAGAQMIELGSLSTVAIA